MYRSTDEIARAGPHSDRVPTCADDNGFHRSDGNLWLDARADGELRASWSHSAQVSVLLAVAQWR